MLQITDILPISIKLWRFYSIHDIFNLNHIFFLYTGRILWQKCGRMECTEFGLLCVISPLLRLSMLHCCPGYDTWLYLTACIGISCTWFFFLPTNFLSRSWQVMYYWKALALKLWNYMNPMCILRGKNENKVNLFLSWTVNIFYCNDFLIFPQRN